MILTYNLVTEGVLKGTAEKTPPSPQIQKAGFGLFSDYGLSFIKESESSWWNGCAIATVVGWNVAAVGFVGACVEKKHKDNKSDAL